MKGCVCVKAYAVEERLSGSFLWRALVTGSALNWRGYMVFVAWRENVQVHPVSNQLNKCKFTGYEIINFYWLLSVFLFSVTISILTTVSLHLLIKPITLVYLPHQLCTPKTIHPHTAKHIIKRNGAESEQVCPERNQIRPQE